MLYLAVIYVVTVSHHVASNGLMIDELDKI
jgi:hypothetical protein